MKASSIEFDNAAANAATGEKGRYDHRFLTVHEVAALLQVPVFLGLRTHAQTVERAITGLSSWEVLAFQRKRGTGMGQT